MDEKVKKLIELTKSIIYGTDTDYGLLQCMDGYFINSFNEELSELDKLIAELEDEP